VGALKKAGIVLDRKVLAELALALPTDFAAVVRVANA
jgi:large subunit ribosomal protein L20